MTTRRLFREDAYLLEFDARVTARLTHEQRPAVTLDQTAFYAESGGQPWDTGTLNDVSVVAVVESGREILHVLDRCLDADSVFGRVDEVRRRDHREQHHGQHLLSRALEMLAGARTVSFHLGGGAVSIDLDREVSEAQVRAAEERANEVIWAARPVAVRVVSRAEAKALGVAPHEGAGDAIRLVDAEGFDLQACGGTHPRSTSEVGMLVILRRERYKGGSRVSFVCGHRALDAFRQRAAALDRLTSILSSPLEGLAEAAQRLLDERSAAEKRVRDLFLKSLDVEAQRLLGSTPGSPPVVVASYEGWAPDELRALAQRLTALRPCVALLASRGAKAQLVFAQSDALPHDIPGLLQTAAARLGGRGGGKGNLAQGGGDRVEKLDEALALAAEAVRARSSGR